MSSNITTYFIPPPARRAKIYDYSPQHPLTGVLERAKLIITMLRPGMRFNIGTVGTGPSMECFPGYKNATKTNILTASRFIEVCVAFKENNDFTVLKFN